MAKSINKVQLIGTLGRDPEVRYMPNGNAVANLSLATDDSYNDKTTGQKVEQTDWHRLVVYGKLAEIVQQHIKKGSRAYFEGKLKTREWEKDGIKHYTTEIVVNDMIMLDGKQQGQQGQYQQPQQQYQPRQPYQQQPQQQPAQPPQGYTHGYQTGLQQQQAPAHANQFDDDPSIPF